VAENVYKPPTGKELAEVKTKLINLTQAELEQIQNADSYLVYTALLTQTGTNAPAATVLKNTLGVNITPERGGTGVYRLVRSSGEWDQLKTSLQIGTSFAFDGDTGQASIYHMNGQPTKIVIATAEFATDGTVSFIDNSLIKTLVEIRVYP